MSKTKKLPKGKITVDNLLGMDDVNDVIAYLADNKHRIKDICCVIQPHDGSLEVKSTSTPLYLSVAMLEMAKLLMIQTEWFGLED